MSIYVLRCAYDGNGKPADPARPHYLYRSVSVSRRRGSWGHLRWMVTPDIEQARTWRTREGVEGYLAAKFTYERELSPGSGVYSRFIVEEVTA